ncbi:MAG: nuclear transport factor 2 family protein [Thaumarchaeota archaeon]|nr:nuclear transport factor 2 family protein [Nitrososphaerota archaeon]
MSKQENLRTFDEWISAHRAHDLDKLITFVTDDITIRSAAGENMPAANGKKQAREHWNSIYTTFPDMKMEAVAVTAEDDRVVAEISHGGTMRGKMGNQAPTGKSYKLTGAFRMDFTDGKIQRIQSYWDTASMAGQLGITP